MDAKNEDALHTMMRDMKVSNKNYYLLKEKKVKENQEKIKKMHETIKN
jgi:hypothetical protein